MKMITTALLLSLAGAGQAAVTPDKPVTTAPAAPPAARRFPGVSDAGNAILTKAQSAPDAQLQQLAKDQRAARDSLTAAVMAPVIDIDKVTAALRQQETVQAQMRTHNNDRLIAVLKQLPDEDRGTFLRTLLLARTTRPAG